MDDVIMNGDAVAAAILVQTVFNSDERLRTLLNAKTAEGPIQQGEEATGNFLKPWYAAMLKIVRNSQR